MKCFISRSNYNSVMLPTVPSSICGTLTFETTLHPMIHICTPYEFMMKFNYVMQKWNQTSLLKSPHLFGATNAKRLVMWLSFCRRSNYLNFFNFYKMPTLGLLIWDQNYSLRIAIEHCSFSWCQKSQNYNIRCIQPQWSILF